MSVEGYIVTFISLTFKSRDETSEVGSNIITVICDKHLIINTYSFTNFDRITDDIDIYASFEQFGSLEI